MKRTGLLIGSLDPRFYSVDFDFGHGARFSKVFGNFSGPKANFKNKTC